MTIESKIDDLSAAIQALTEAVRAFSTARSEPARVVSAAAPKAKPGPKKGAKAAAKPNGRAPDPDEQLEELRQGATSRPVVSQAQPPVAYADVRAALLAFAKVHGEAKALDVLKRNGVSHATQLKAEQWPKVVEDFKS